MEKHKYRSIFISDTHLGARYSNPDKLFSFLKSVECDYIFLVGDIFDFWAIKRNPSWNDHSNDVLRKFLKIAKKSKVYYLTGNHDEVVRKFTPTSFENIIVVDEFIHTLQNNKKVILVHGDIFDFVTGNLKWLAKIGSTIYDYLIILNRFIHWIQFHLGLPYWSISKFAKSKTKKALSHIKNFENLAIDYAKEKGCDLIICGHIHTPKLSECYANCGDWVENFSYIVEEMDGTLKLLQYNH